ncbi:triacylglycerol lipase [Variovorax sp. J22R115]|uniref:esterase/lipase family protein n=1 Tax=Variovorax sp. J22R115 TaxID=3053509 RepID=UPI002574B931|nr:alpha/beta fold hydrolase [Variovorax sp. J22R115]MDM0051661.1 alpha/beta fold hydrolase [Variovorax sp. J22R115]
MPAQALSRALRIALMALCVMASGCGLLQADQQMRRLGDAMYFTGIVETEKEARGPIVVVLYRLGAKPEPVFLDVIPRSRGVYHLAGPPAQYGILAFEDVDRDMVYGAGEPAVLYEGTALGIEAVDDPPTSAKGLGRILIPATATAKTLPPVFDEAYAALVRRRNEGFGAQATIDEGRFAPNRVREGLFQPLRFIEEGRAGLFMLEPYDPKRIPVIFVHGVGGSPRNWEYVIDKLDRTRFQPWVFFYPSGFSIGLSALFLNNAVDELHYRYGFPTSIVVAHSMGGLVARGALNIIVREGRTPPVHHVVTISTPWLGHSAARWADIGPTRVPGSWLDMAPNSPYLSELMVNPRPADIRYTLFFGFGGPSRFVAGNNDGSVSLDSVLAPDIQARANYVFGFDEGHVSILRSSEMIDKLMQRMRDEANRLPATH